MEQIIQVNQGWFLEKRGKTKRNATKTYKSRFTFQLAMIQAQRLSTRLTTTTTKTTRDSRRSRRLNLRRRNSSSSRDAGVSPSSAATSFPVFPVLVLRGRASISRRPWTSAVERRSRKRRRVADADFRSVCGSGQQRNGIRTSEGRTPRTTLASGRRLRLKQDHSFILNRLSRMSE